MRGSSIICWSTINLHLTFSKGVTIKPHPLTPLPQVGEGILMIIVPLYRLRERGEGL